MNGTHVFRKLPGMFYVALYTKYPVVLLLRSGECGNDVESAWISCGMSHARLQVELDFPLSAQYRHH